MKPPSPGILLHPCAFYIPHPCKDVFRGRGWGAKNLASSKSEVSKRAWREGVDDKQTPKKAAHKHPALRRQRREVVLLLLLSLPAPSALSLSLSILTFSQSLTSLCGVFCYRVDQLQKQKEQKSRTYEMKRPKIENSWSCLFFSRVSHLPISLQFSGSPVFYSVAGRRNLKA